jgi:SnoaL-like protein
MTEADVLTRLLHAVDALDWVTVRDAFAAEVLVDYTSLSGGEPETLPAGDLVARWQGLLPGFDATQHLTGPVLVSRDGGPGIRADTHVIGYHRMQRAGGPEIWVVHGHYTARVVDGKITELTLTVFFQDGQLDLPEVATERAAAGQGRAGR